MILKKNNPRLPLLSTYSVVKKVGVFLKISRLLNGSKCKATIEIDTSEKFDKLFNI